jgi:hypothetical protein
MPTSTRQRLEHMAAMAVISEIEFMELGMSLAAPPKWRNRQEKKIDDEGLNIGRSIRGIADEGYRGEPEYLSTRNQFNSKEIAWFKSRALARHETFNAKLKTFQILDGTFRHSHNQHQAVFEAVCAVTVYKMDVRAGLLDPYP